MCETDATNRFCNENMYNVSIYVIDNVLFTYEFSYKLHLFSYKQCYEISTLRTFVCKKKEGYNENE